MEWWKNLKRTLRDLVGRRRDRENEKLNPGQDEPAIESGFITPGEEIPSNPTWQRIITDISDETVFKGYVGVSEEEFMVHVLSVLEKAGKDIDAAGETGNTEVDDTTSTGIDNAHYGVQPGYKKLFESLEAVKHLRVVEKKLSARHHQVATAYPFTWYTDSLARVQATAGMEKTTADTGEEDTADNSKNKANGNWIFASLREQAEIEISQLRQFVYGQGTTEKGQENEIEKKAVAGGTLEAMQQDYEERRNIKQLRLEDVRNNLDYFSGRNAEEIYKQAANAYASYFWSLLGISMLLLLLTFFCWYLISPLAWRYLPLGFLFASVLLLIPARGFKGLFEQKNRDSDSSRANEDGRIKLVTEQPDGLPEEGAARPSQNWLLVSFDILIPLSIALIMIFLNWDLTGGNWITLATLLGVFLFFLCIRICTVPLLTGFKRKYNAAREKVFAKKAFVKYYREHLSILKEANLDDHHVEKETLESFRVQFEINKQTSKRVEEILFNEKELCRQAFSSLLRNDLADQETLKNSFFTESAASPNRAEIPDLLVVRTLLTRLEYLFDTAAGS